MINDIIEKARGYAFNKHENPAEACRYGNQPYSKHLIDVVAVANKYIGYIEKSMQDNIYCACYCHDLVEDTACTPKELARLFNHEVADIVYRVSNERGLSARAILFKTLPKIWENRYAKFVKLCDRIANGTSSKSGFDKKSSRTYQRYLNEYPIFRYALMNNEDTGEIDYPDMWVELDDIFEYK